MNGRDKDRELCREYLGVRVGFCGAEVDALDETYRGFCATHAAQRGLTTLTPTEEPA